MSMVDMINHAVISDLSPGEIADKIISSVSADEFSCQAKIRSSTILPVQMVEIKGPDDFEIEAFIKAGNDPFWYDRTLTSHKIKTIEYEISHPTVSSSYHLLEPERNHYVRLIQVMKKIHAGCNCVKSIFYVDVILDEMLKGDLAVTQHVYVAIIRPELYGGKDRYIELVTAIYDKHLGLHDSGGPYIGELLGGSIIFAPDGIPELLKDSAQNLWPMQRD